MEDRANSFAPIACCLQHFTMAQTGLRIVFFGEEEIHVVALVVGRAGANQEVGHVRRIVTQLGAATVGGIDRDRGLDPGEVLEFGRRLPGGVVEDPAIVVEILCVLYCVVQSQPRGLERLARESDTAFTKCRFELPVIRYCPRELS